MEAIDVPRSHTPPMFLMLAFKNAVDANMSSRGVASPGIHAEPPTSQSNPFFLVYCANSFYLCEISTKAPENG